MKAILAGKEYTFRDHTSLRMQSSANIFAMMLRKQLGEYIKAAADADKEDAEYSSSVNAINDSLDKVESSFINFCRSAFVENVECKYLDITQEEAAALWQSFFGGFTATETPN